MINRIKRNYVFRTIEMMPLRIRLIYLSSMLVETIERSVLLNIILAFIIKDIIDAATQGEIAFFKLALIKAGIAMFLGCPTICILNYVIDKYREKTSTHIRKQVFSHITRLGQQKLEGKHSGDLISRTTNDLETMIGFFRELHWLFYGVIHGSIAIIAIFVLDFRFGLLVLLLGIITLLSNILVKRPLRRWSDLVQKHMGILTERLIDLLEGIYVTKIYHREQDIHDLYTKRNDKMLASIIRRSRVEAFFNMIKSLIEILNRLGLLCFGLYLLLKGDAIAVGTIAAIIYLQSYAKFFFNEIGNFIVNIQRALAGAGRIFEILDTEVETENDAYSYDYQTISKEDKKTIISIKDLSFTYKKEETQADNMILNNIDINISLGQNIALVGPSGGGKSTLIKLLLGFYSPSEGEIIIDGKSIRHYSLSQLREKMAYVPQDSFLFNDTIEENIRYGKLDANHSHLVMAATKGNAHNFILNQPDGYGTVVGQDGCKLSGGERQRLAIARALLKDAPILLLDEASSALDSESERMIQDALETLIKENTTIAIAHRLSTVKSADAIYVIDKGRIVEQGTHNVLLANGGLYQRLYEMQFKAT